MHLQQRSLTLNPRPTLGKLVLKRENAQIGGILTFFSVPQMDSNWSSEPSWKLNRLDPTRIFGRVTRTFAMATKASPMQQIKSDGTKVRRGKVWRSVALEMCQSVPDLSTRVLPFCCMTPIRPANFGAMTQLIIAVVIGLILVLNSLESNLWKTDYEPPHTDYPQYTDETSRAIANASMTGSGPEVALVEGEWLPFQQPFFRTLSSSWRELGNFAISAVPAHSPQNCAAMSPQRLQCRQEREAKVKWPKG